MYLFGVSSPSPSITCTSESPARVVIESTWVWPLLNSPDPWVLLNNPTSDDKGLISSRALPSGLLSSSIIPLLTSSTSIDSIAASISFPNSSNSSLKCS